MDKAEVFRKFDELKVTLNVDYSLKDEQADVISKVINRRDVFAVLPTGYGKSLCYIVPPLLLTKLTGSQKTALVVSPLKALMLQQAQKLREMGLKAFAICDGGLDSESICGIQSGKADVLFASPESVLQDRWLKVIQRKYLQQIILQAYDEVHCISEWGLEFRPHYRRVTQLCSIIEAPTLCLTATATDHIQKDVYGVLCLDDDATDVVSHLPNRPNVFLHFHKGKENSSQEMKWLEACLQAKGIHAPKTIVFYDSIHRCQADYNLILENLGSNVYVDDRVALESRMVEMFHSATSEQTKARILGEFPSPTSKIRIVFATVAFGMGIDIPDIQIVVNWGVPPSILQFWQESGRCGRDGRRALSVCYAFSRSVSKCKDETLKEMANLQSCLRKLALTPFLLKGMAKNSFLELGKAEYICIGDCQETCRCKLCSCCTYCLQKCSCDKKPEDIISAFTK